MTNKIIAVCLIVTALGLFSACGKENSATVSELSSSSMPDFQYMFKADGVRTPTQKSNSGYYNVVANNIVYTDADTLKTTPLCNKSDCLHTSDFPYCNSKINDRTNTFDNFQIYRDKLYYLAEDLSDSSQGESKLLKCISLDGSEKNTVLNLKDKFIVDWFIYDGYFYYQSGITVNDDNSQTKSGNYYRIDLSTKSEEEFIDFSELENIYGAEVSMRNIYESFMYVTLSGFSSEDTYNKMINGEEFNGDASAIRKIARYDLKDGSSITVDPYDNDYEFVGFSNGKLVGTDTSAEGKTKMICISELDGTNPSVITEVNNLYQVFCDDNYIYVYNQSVILENAERKTVTVYDKTGKKLSTAYLPDLIENNLITFYDEYIWFYIQSDSAVILCVIDKSELLNNEKEVTYQEVYRYE